MPILRMPDGQQVRFPDDMPKEEILGMIQQKYPDFGKPAASAETEFGLTDTWPFRLARGLYEGAKDAATLPGDVYTGKQSLDDPTLTPRALNFAALASPVNPAVRSGERAIPGMARAETKPAPAPTRAALDKAADEGFDAFRKSGANIKSSSMAQFAQEMRQDLLKEGRLPTDATGAHGLLDIIEKTPANSFMSPEGFHSFRKALQRKAGNYANPEDQAAANIIINRLDKWFDTLPPTGFVDRAAAEAAPAARAAFKDARGNSAAGFRSDKITGREHDVDLRAAATYSGKNFDNAMRQRLAGLVTNKNASRGFSPEEIAQTEDVIRGSFLTNRVRDTANILGGGKGMASLLSGALGATAAGAASLNPLLGLGLPLTGIGLKGVENAMTRSAVRKLDEAIRSRSPLAKNAQPITPYPVGNDALMRGLLQYYLQNPNQS